MTLPSSFRELQCKRTAVGIMDIDAGPQSTATQARQADSVQLSSNGLLSDMQSLNADIGSDSSTEREQLDMLTSNGLLDGALDDGVVQSLGSNLKGDLFRSTQTPSSEKNDDEGIEGIKDSSTALREKSSGSGLLPGDLPSDVSDHESCAGEIKMMPSATKPLQASPGNPKNVHANPLSTAEAFQANGLLSSMEEETLTDTNMKDVRTRSASADTTAAIVSGFQDNGLLGGLDDLPADQPVTAPIALSMDTASVPVVDGKTIGRDHSSLDRLLDDMDSAGYTTLQKSKARAVPLPAIREKHPALVHDRRTVTPIPAGSISVSPVETGHPRSNPVSRMDVAHNLMPLEAIDQNGRKVMFKRRARKSLDGRAVSLLQILRESITFCQ